MEISVGQLDICLEPYIKVSGCWDYETFSSPLLYLQITPMSMLYYENQRNVCNTWSLREWWHQESKLLMLPCLAPRNYGKQVKKKAGGGGVALWCWNLGIVTATNPFPITKYYSPSNLQWMQVVFLRQTEEIAPTMITIIYFIKQ